MGLSILVLFIALGYTAKLYQGQKKERERIESNLKESKSKWIDERGYLVNQVSALSTTNKEIRNIFSREKDEIVNNYEKRIYAFKEELRALNIKVNHLRGIISTGLTVTDTIIISVHEESDSIVSGKYESKHLDARIDYFPIEKEFLLDYLYRDSINVLKIVSAKPKKNGKERWLFPNWLWLWGEKEEYLVYSKNEKSVVDVNIITEIQK